jgi:ABC-2 type transport system ATP-binding protein
MLGIIGTNGAGKSTLLKAVTGIMVPTEGQVIAKGNIVALLELASGFDDELTVRENTFLRGALLGYTRKFMNEKYDEIIEFAELEDFQEHMFKQLSSGMKSRLAFSIACMVEPDILILDEVLSVGDEGFKDKSAHRMKEIIEKGVTGMFVSHSVNQIRDVCNKCLWLDHGKQIAFDNTYEVCNAYSYFLFTPKEQRRFPQSKEELYDISDRFAVAWRLGEMEKQDLEVITSDWYRRQTETQRLQRLLQKEEQLTPAEYQQILDNIRRSRRVNRK